MNRTIGGPTTVQVRERGQFTIPAEVRRQVGIREGDTFSLLWLDDTLIAIRRRLVTPEIARAIEALMQQKGLTLEDLLEGLEEVRQTYLREQYNFG
ncbi:MAG: AbrB/MazE/SpoVT family DNA-binding domain-containing protein [Thermoflexales bacterium]|nr:AbrB/MazE/SpoVT family DNA-binding domain-containing protein [Thermoflexales bacterium]